MDTKLADLKASYPAAGLTYDRLVRQLAQLTAIVNPHDLRPETRLDHIIPAEQRRWTWDRLREAGFQLPELTLSSGVWLITALVVVGPVMLLTVLLKSWLSLLALARLGRFAYRITRPLAIHPPECCANLHDACLHLTHFNRADHEAGLWTKADTAARVRYLVACAAGRPFSSISDDTKLFDLC